MKHLRRLLLSVALVATACGPMQTADEFRAASPSRQGLKIEIPASGSKALSDGDVGSQKQGLGQTAELYKATVFVTTVVNGGLVFVAHLCEDIVKQEPTKQTADQAVWGPATPDLSPDTFRFTVTRKGTAFDYALEARPKTAADSAFVTLLSGTHTPDAKSGGKGSFTIDWDAAQAMARPPKEIGKASYAYEKNAAGDVVIGTQFRQVRDDATGLKIDADYGYSKLVGGEGAFEFAVQKDLQANASRNELFAIRSRWQDKGMGRSDFTISGGDVTTPVTASECWSETFGRTYYKDSANFSPAEGDEKSCAFAQPSYPAPKS